MKDPKLNTYNWRQLVLDDSDLPFHSKAIALFLSTYMNDYHDTAWPAINTIKERLSLGSRSTVIKYIHLLVDHGYLVATRQYAKTTRYTAVVPSSPPHGLSSSPPDGLTVVHQVDTNNQFNNQTALAGTDVPACASSEDDTPAESIAVTRSGKPNCPHSKIADLYHEILPMLKPIIEVTPTRQTHLRTIWSNPKQANYDLDYFRQYFEAISRSKFLTGLAQPTQGRTRPFKADFDFVIRQKTLISVQEGKYHG